MRESEHMHNGNMVAKRVMGIELMHKCIFHTMRPSARAKSFIFRGNKDKQIIP